MARDYRTQYVERLLDKPENLKVESVDGKFHLTTPEGFKVEIKLVLPSKIVTKNDSTGEVTTITRLGISVRTPQARALKQEHLFNGQE